MAWVSYLDKFLMAWVSYRGILGSYICISFDLTFKRALFYKSRFEGGSQSFIDLFRPNVLHNFLLDYAKCDLFCFIVELDDVNKLT